MNGLRKDLATATIAIVFLTLLLGIAYPLVTTGVAQLIFPNAETLLRHAAPRSLLDNAEVLDRLRLIVFENFDFPRLEIRNWRAVTRDVDVDGDEVGARPEARQRLLRQEDHCAAHDAANALEHLLHVMHPLHSPR